MTSYPNLPPDFHNLTDPWADSDTELYCWKHRPCFYSNSSWKKQIHEVILNIEGKYFLKAFLVFLRKKRFFSPGNTDIMGSEHSKSEDCSEGEFVVISNSDFIVLAPENSRLLWFTWKWISVFRPCKVSQSRAIHPLRLRGTKYIFSLGQKFYPV